MFKSGRSRYYAKRRRKFSPLKILGISLVSIPLLLIFLEVAARIVVNVLGKAEELAAYQGETYEGNSAIATAYRLQFISESQQPYEGLSQGGGLIAQRSPSVGYQLLGNQTSPYWNINEQGFRDVDPVPLAKPANEIRIFILGGSAAFGYWRDQNQSLMAQRLESRLNERVAQQKRSPEKYRPDVLSFYKPERAKALALPSKIRSGQYRVINAAVPGYASGNELAQLALKVLPYKPDIIILFNGYTDLMLPSGENLVEIPYLENFLQDASQHFATYLKLSLKQKLHQTYTMKALQYWFVQPELSTAQRSLVLMNSPESFEKYLPPDETELDQRIARYEKNLKQMIQLATGAGASTIVAIQPEITGHSPDKLSEKEQFILQELEDNYQENVSQGYEKLLKTGKKFGQAFPRNVKVLNFYHLPDNFPSPSFDDAIHLTEEAHQMLSERLYYTITELSKIQVIPENFILE